MPTELLVTDIPDPMAGPPHADETRPAFEVEVFFDGACPLCRREIGMLRRLDRHGRLRLTDISAPEFDAAPLGRTHDELMREIKARLPDGTWITGVEVFRRLYGAVGFRWLIPVTRLPLVRQMLDIGYRVFARNRLRLTGRCTDACRIDQPDSARLETTDVGN
jgi:predicted DCC family thiol-disulfide oxidoreductase YuxK